MESYNQSVNLFKNGEKKFFMVHRLVLSAFLGPSDLVADHINGDRFDNRLSNLRYCTRKENNNFDNYRRPCKTSRFKGVHFNFNKGKWIASTNINKKPTYIGIFNSEISARRAYLKYEKTYNP